MTSKTLIKETGATFTPSGLAQFLAREIVGNLVLSNTGSPLSILDPACGDGQLLCAINDVLKEKGHDQIHLVGYDSNSQFLEDAKGNFSKKGIETFSLHKDDFLDQFDSGDVAQSSLFDELTHSSDIVIANPPYVRTQILGTVKAQKIAKKFNLKGRVDLYYPFLIAMTKSLKFGGNKRKPLDNAHKRRAKLGGRGRK